MIIQNGVVNADGQIYLSRHRYDFKTIEDNSGRQEGFIDGGLDYIKRGTYSGIGMTEIILTEKSTMLEILERLVCETHNKFWSVMTMSEIKTERSNISYWQKTKFGGYFDHTKLHSQLHLYVGGYWLVRKTTIMENSG
jgi:hypothetical protein